MNRNIMTYKRIELDTDENRFIDITIDTVIVVIVIVIVYDNLMYICSFF